MKKSSKLVWTTLVLAAAVSTLLIYVIPLVAELAREQETKDNLHALQLAAERYSVNDPLDYYPPTIEVAIAAGNLPSMPINPYTHRPMKNVQLGNDPAPGDFTYVTNTEEIAPGYTFTTQYLLVAYSMGGRELDVSYSPSGQGYYETEYPTAKRVVWGKVCAALESGFDLGDIVVQREHHRREFIEQHGGKVPDSGL